MRYKIPSLSSISSRQPICHKMILCKELWWLRECRTNIKYKVIPSSPLYQAAVITIMISKYFSQSFSYFAIRMLRSRRVTQGSLWSHSTALCTSKVPLFSHASWVHTQSAFLRTAKSKTQGLAKESSVWIVDLPQSRVLHARQLVRQMIVRKLSVGSRNPHPCYTILRDESRRFAVIGG